MVFVQYVCAFILLWSIVSAVWPDTGKQQVESARKQQAYPDGKHTELLAPIAKLERQTTLPALMSPPPFTAPTLSR